MSKNEFGLPEFIFRVIVTQDNLAPCELCGEEARFTLNHVTDELMAYCTSSKCINHIGRNYRFWPLKTGQTWEEFFDERGWE